MPDGDCAPIFLVRHGRVHNPHRVAYGFLPRMGLAPDGRIAAAATARFLRERGPVALFTSPLLRAVQTARIIHDHLPGVPVHRSWLLRESELARVWQGTPIHERQDRFPAEYRLFMEAPSQLTAGETLAAQAERMCRLLQRAARRYPRGPLLAVSHRDPILALRLTVEGQSLDGLHTTPCEPASVTELRRCAGRLHFVAYHEPWSE